MSLTRRNLLVSMASALAVSVQPDGARAEGSPEELDLKAKAVHDSIAENLGLNLPLFLDTRDDGNAFFAAQAKGNASVQDAEHYHSILVSWGNSLIEIVRRGTDATSAGEIASFQQKSTELRDQTRRIYPDLEIPRSEVFVSTDHPLGALIVGVTECFQLGRAGSVASLSDIVKTGLRGGTDNDSKFGQKIQDELMRIGNQQGAQRPPLQNHNFPRSLDRNQLGQQRL